MSKKQNKNQNKEGTYIGAYVISIIAVIIAIVATTPSSPIDNLNYERTCLESKDVVEYDTAAQKEGSCVGCEELWQQSYYCEQLPQITVDEVSTTYNLRELFCDRLWNGPHEQEFYKKCEKYNIPSYIEGNCGTGGNLKTTMTTTTNCTKVGYVFYEPVNYEISKTTTECTGNMTCGGE